MFFNLEDSMAAVIFAFSRLGTRPKRTAENEHHENITAAVKDKVHNIFKVVNDIDFREIVDYNFNITHTRVIERRSIL